MKTSIHGSGLDGFEGLQSTYGVAGLANKAKREHLKGGVLAFWPGIRV